MALEDRDYMRAPHWRPGDMRVDVRPLRPRRSWAMPALLITLVLGGAYLGTLDLLVRVGLL